jgi:thioesterase domain-containing protein
MREASLDELASLYTQELRAFLPDSPYVLGGLSFGGLVAFEMAQKLAAQGAGPELLVVFDTTVPGSEQRVELSDRARVFWRNLRSQGASYLAHKAKAKLNYWGKLLQNIASYFYRKTGRELPAGLRYYQMQETHWRTLKGHDFKPYPGKIALMRAVDRFEILGKREDPVLGWRDLAGGELEILDIPSGHTAMLLEPAVQLVAEKLKILFPLKETTVPRRQPAA